ncbi:MAG: low molecular weight protein-tyrosine-phosphatase [Pseudomonadota bacterium]
MTKVLFVCLGNICRSPTATAVFRARAAEAGLDAAADGAGTGGWHIGDPPDPRATAEAARRGYDMSALRARQAKAADFAAYDLILAMDRSNLAALERLRPADARAELKLFLDYAPGAGRRDVPDPYYEGGFDLVLDLIEEAADGLIEALRRA